MVGLTKVMKLIMSDADDLAVSLLVNVGVDDQHGKKPKQILDGQQ